jgi:C-methyltransferase C-terminal domain
LFRRHALFVNRLEHLPIHGGSLRLFVEPSEKVSCSVTGSLRDEAARGLRRPGYYLEFAARVREIRRELRALLVRLKRQGNRIAAYGAAAKGATLINYVDIGKDLVDFVVDRNTHKQVLYMPGKHLPILSPEKLVEERPHYTLLLTWNFSDEILQQQESYRQLGGKFIIPIPHPCVV